MKYDYNGKWLKSVKLDKGIRLFDALDNEGVVFEYRIDSLLEIADEDGNKLYKHFLYQPEFGMGMERTFDRYKLLAE